MVGLHEAPHAATQVPAQLVGSAAACERRWRFDWCGPDGGPTGVPGKGLVGPPARVLPWRLLSSPAKLLPGALWSSLAGIPPRIILLKGVSDLECLHKDLHATTGRSPESLPHGGSGLKGDSLRRCGASCHGKGLAGLAKAAPGKDLAGGSALSPLLFVVLVLVSFCFSCASALPWLTSRVVLGVAAPVAQTARAQL